MRGCSETSSQHSHNWRSNHNVINDNNKDPNMFTQTVGDQISKGKKHYDHFFCDMGGHWPDTSGHKCWTYHSGPEDFNNLLMKFCREFSILQVHDHHDYNIRTFFQLQKIIAFTKMFAVVIRRAELFSKSCFTISIIAGRTEVWPLWCDPHHFAKVI